MKKCVKSNPIFTPTFNPIYFVNLSKSRKSQKMATQFTFGEIPLCPHTQHIVMTANKSAGEEQAFLQFPLETWVQTDL